MFIQAMLQEGVEDKISNKDIKPSPDVTFFNYTYKRMPTGLKDEKIKQSVDACFTIEDVTDEKLISALNSISTRE